jgi:hypothetical protein
MMAKEYESAPAMAIDPEKKYTVKIETTEGDITAELFPKDAPGLERVARVTSSRQSSTSASTQEACFLPHEVPILTPPAHSSSSCTRRHRI